MTGLSTPTPTVAAAKDSRRNLGLPRSTERPLFAEARAARGTNAHARHTPAVLCGLNRRGPRLRLAPQTPVSPGRLAMSSACVESTMGPDRSDRATALHRDEFVERV